MRDFILVLTVGANCQFLEDGLWHVVMCKLILGFG